MKALFVRKERAANVRNALISKGVEFYEERDNFHFLFIFPSLNQRPVEEGKWLYFCDDNLDEVETRGKTFKIEGARELIDRFATDFEKRGLKVKLENPDNTVEIRNWGKRYLVSVF